MDEIDQPSAGCQRLSVAIWTFNRIGKRNRNDWWFYGSSGFRRLCNGQNQWRSKWYRIEFKYKYFCFYCRNRGFIVLFELTAGSRQNRTINLKFFREFINKRVELVCNGSSENKSKAVSGNYTIVQDSNLESIAWFA